MWDEATTIRRSLRCFWFGLMGMIPGVGVTLAWQALQLNSEKQRWNFGLALLIIAIPGHAILQATETLAVAWGANFLLATIYSFWSARLYFQTPPTHWNPARAWAWTGAFLARLGLAFTLLAIESAYLAAYLR